MRIEFDRGAEGAGGALAAPACRVTGEARRLRHVLLAAPTFLEAVPCCAATEASLRGGFRSCVETARAEHAGLRAALEAAGVRCSVVPGAVDAPDLCFARDGAVATPWGLAVLNPALPHRRRESDHVVAALAGLGVTPFARITRGTIEGGDVCVLAPGRLVIGCSGERTTGSGADELAGLFRARGWDVLVARFDPRFLHLDTIFCALDGRAALADLDALDPGFVAAVRAWGVALVPVTRDESATLGCNVLSIDGRRIVVAAGHERVAREIGRAGFEPIAVPVAQFTRCGGGIHCLTMPILRD